MSECGEVERLGIAVTQARLRKLKEYEGCRVKYCDGDGCLEGVLEEADLEAAAITVRTAYGLVVMPFKPDEFELTVYQCKDGHGG